MNVEVKIDVKQVLAAMDNMRKRALNLRPFMGAVGMIMIKSTHENFEAEGRPAKWIGWSPLTKKIYDGQAMDNAIGKGLKSKHKTQKGRANFIHKQYKNNLVALGARKILQSSGGLKKSIVIGKLTSSSVEVGSSLEYSRIQQVGGVILPKKAKSLAIPLAGGFLKLKKTKLPARPYLKLQQSDNETILRVAKDYLERGVIG
ncbi:phage virion morphogenesis protein [Paenibacillus alba]|uniref:Phage virion morphogenesis protein n=1 Tax=Paenibacillus alba TaxID=1197127 RepID=A0ABU6GAR6_9BACL|nr:phage virion morphogenesis protein [Paenibacillus alba]MEC0231290.1 phage virion morphogenesis protein [Paenibacillus alba]